MIQSKAEEKLIAQFPDIYPPRPIKYVLAAYRKWRRGEAKGTLVSAVRAEFADLREVRKEMGVAERSARSRRPHTPGIAPAAQPGLASRGARAPCARPCPRVGGDVAR